MGAAPTIYTIPSHTQTPACGFAITYTALLNGSPLPNFISFDLVDTITISTSDFDNIGSFDVEVTYHLTDDEGSKEGLFFTLNIDI